MVLKITLNSKPQQNKNKKLNYYMSQVQSNEIYENIKKETSSDIKSEESNSDSLSNSNED